MGKLATVIGVGLALYAMFLMPSGFNGTSNLELLNMKTNLVIAAAAMFLGGIVADAAQRIQAEVEKISSARRIEAAIKGGIVA